MNDVLTKDLTDEAKPKRGAPKRSTAKKAMKKAVKK